MSAESRAIAVVSAGWSPTVDDPLAEYTQGKSKTLIPIAGKPMITHIIDALANSRTVKHIVIVALDPDADVQFPVAVEYVPDAGGILDNAEAGLEYALNHYPDLDVVLLCTSDIPTITGPIVDALVEECLRTDHDLYYTVIERSVMEKRFPGSRRSYIHLREGDFAGGDIIVVRPSLGITNRDLWDDLAAARKNAFRQARLVGLGIFLRLITRRLSLADAERRISKVLNVHGRVVPFPHAEVGMDVDKPPQLEIVRAELEARTGNSS